MEYGSIVLTLAAALASGPRSVAAEGATGVEGERWAGSIVLPGGSRLDFRVELERQPDVDRAWLWIPVQGLERVPLRDVGLDEQRLRFTLAEPNPPTAWAVFDLGVDAASEIATGSMLQAGRRFRVALQRLAADEPARAGFLGEVPPPPGVPWVGDVFLDNDGWSLRFFVRLVPAEAGQPASGTIDFPVQDVSDAPLHDLDVGGSNLRFTYAPKAAPVLGKARFDLEIVRDGEAIGTMIQLGKRRSVVARPLRPGESLPPGRRPQHPRPPFPYAKHEVAFDGGAPGVRLAGTLTVPEGDGPHSAALLLTGSGAQDRDEMIFGHRPFLVLADHLTRRGVAVLRVDDRGVGGSTGSFATATTADFADDARAGLAFLAARPEVDADRVGMVGHSEGGMAAIQVAGSEAPPDRAGVAWVVLLASPGVSGRELLLYQVSEMQATSATPDEAKRAAREAGERALDALARGAGPQELRTAVTTLVEAQIALSGGAPPPRAQVDVLVTQGLARMDTDWYRGFAAYDPAGDLARIDVPVLALNGGLDVQVPAAENLAAIASGLGREGAGLCTTEELAGLNHLFQNARTGAMAEYGLIEETLEPSVLERIAGWILER